MRSRKLSIVCLFSAFALGLGAGACFLRERPSGAGGAAVAAPKLQPDEARLVDVFRDAAAAVVNISNNAVRRGFLSLDVEEVPRGSGSGVVWDKKGHIVTNFHVVAGASSITVTLADGTVWRVKEIAGVYPDMDVAVIRIDAPAEKLHPIRTGRSSELLVGMQAIAIGNPFGFDQTMTTGIVSALGREMRSLTGRRIVDVIQTDAAVNTGNSGGPLLNSAGEMIGITTAIYSPSGTNSGVAFAVPIDGIRRVVEDLITRGKVLRPGMGVELFSDRIARHLQLTGIPIKSVAPGSAAARSGLRGTKIYTNGEYELGDVITAIDGKPLRELNDLLDTLDRHQVGDEVEVTFQRGGKTQKATVKLQQIEIAAE
jgi:S1-C subfamily serine protease